MHRYRSHTCAALRNADAGATVRLSGWVHRVRDHGGVLFIDLRDHFGITQCVVDPDSDAFKLAETVRAEWCIRIDGEVKGDIVGMEKVVITKTGKVQGNIVGPRVTLEDGAKFKGSIDMDPGAGARSSTAKGPRAAAPAPGADGAAGSSPASPAQSGSGAEHIRLGY